MQWWQRARKPMTSCGQRLIDCLLIGPSISPPQREPSMDVALQGSKQVANKQAANKQPVSKLPVS